VFKFLQCIYDRKEIEMPDEKIEKKPGVCIPWEEKIKEYEKITGDAELIKKVWEDIDGLAYIYIWFVLIAA
jgi:hypothetical protein